MRYSWYPFEWHGEEKVGHTEELPLLTSRLNCCNIRGSGDACQARGTAKKMLIFGQVTERRTTRDCKPTAKNTLLLDADSLSGWLMTRLL